MAKQIRVEMPDDIARHLEKRKKEDGLQKGKWIQDAFREKYERERQAKK